LCGYFSVPVGELFEYVPDSTSVQE
jgi:putative transcriptional regulator